MICLGDAADGLQKQFSALLLGVGKEVFGRPLFQDAPIIHENNPGGHISGEIHFMGYHQHGHAVFGKLAHD